MSCLSEVGEVKKVALDKLNLSAILTLGFEGCPSLRDAKSPNCGIGPRAVKMFFFHMHSLFHYIIKTHRMQELTSEKIKK